MSKRKRASLGKTSTGADQLGSEPNDAAPKEDMAHVTPDVLAGSPSIFAPKWSADEPTRTGPPEAVSEPVVAEAETKAAAAPVEAVEQTPEPPLETPSDRDPVLAPPVAEALPPPPATTMPRPVRTRGGGSRGGLCVGLGV